VLLPDEPESGKERLATEQLTDACAALEEELEEVKVKYEMYLLGAERMEPARRRDDLKRSVARLKNAFTRNAGLRFRIQALHARYLSYERLWLRSAREKEAGTYRRDVMRARLRASREAARPRPEGEATRSRGAAEVERAEAAAAAASPPESAGASPAVAGGSPAGGTGPRPVPASPPPAPGFQLGEAETRALFDAWVEAKRRCHEDVGGLTPEGLGRSLARQVPAILEKFKARRVEFKVVVQDGKAILKAVPRT
jgi:hypothetical protein